MQVKSIGDGDTLRLQNNNETITVRLGCIDAPETAQKPWGQKSSEFLKNILKLKTTVQVRKISTDRYGRIVAEIYQHGRSINLKMVTSGMAVVYRQYLSGCSNTQDEYLAAEAQAKGSQLGYWNQSKEDICLPWDYRRGNCQTSTSNESLPSCVTTNCNCADFSTHAEAQQVLESFPGDPHRLDRDKDGIACESLR